MPKLSRRGKIALVALLLVVPGLCLVGLFSYLTSSVQVWGELKDLRLLEVREGELHLGALVEVGSNTPVSVVVGDVDVRLSWGGKELGRAELARGFMRLDPGASAEVELDVFIWDLEALGGLLSEGLRSGRARVEVEAEGTVRASVLSFRVHRSFCVEVPVPKLGELVSVRELCLGEGLEANATITFRNPYRVTFEIASLDIDLKHDGEGVGHAVLASPQPILVRPCYRADVPIHLAVEPGAVQLLASSLAEDWGLTSEVEGTICLLLSGNPLELHLSGLELRLGAEPTLVAEPMSIGIEGDLFSAEVIVNASLGPLRGSVLILSCQAEAHVDGESLGTISMAEQEIRLGEPCQVHVLLEPDPVGADLLVQRALEGESSTIEVGNASLSLLVMGEEVQVEVRRSFESVASFDVSYDVEVSQVLSLQPVRPGNVFIADVEIHVSVSSPITSPVVINEVSFDIYSPGGTYLGEGSVVEPVELPSGSGDFYVETSSRLELTRDGVEWLAQQLVDEGSIRLSLRDVLAEVVLGPLDIELHLNELSYVYEPGEVTFDVEDVILASISFNPPGVVFDIDVLIYNPLDFSVNLTYGPRGEPPLSFQLWCQEHNVYLGPGYFDSEVELKAKEYTLIRVRVILTPEGASHVVKPVQLGGHYDPLPPPGRIVMVAAVRNGVAFVGIYDVVVKVSFTVSNVYVNEPLPSGGGQGSSVNAGLQEVGHLHEGLPCLGLPEPFYGLLGLIRQLLDEPPGLVQGASLDEQGSYLVQLLLPDVTAPQELQ